MAFEHVSKYLTFEIAILNEAGKDAALFFAHIKAFYEFFDKNEKLEPVDGVPSFYQSAEQIEKNTGLTYRQQKPLADKLEEIGLIKTVVRPRKKYFSVNWEVYNSIIEKFSAACFAAEEEPSAAPVETPKPAEEIRPAAHDRQNVVHEPAHDQQNVGQISIISNTYKKHDDDRYISAREKAFKESNSYLLLKNFAFTRLDLEEPQFERMVAYLANHTKWSGGYNLQDMEEILAAAERAGRISDPAHFYATALANAEIARHTVEGHRKAIAARMAAATPQAAEDTPRPNFDVRERFRDYLTREERVS